MKRRKRNASAPSVAAAAVEAAVLGNDDLLREILVRHASDPAFLRSFRGLHPPRLLGLYVRGCGPYSRFVPLPHPRELDVVFRRASFQSANEYVIDCRNGRLLVFRLETTHPFGVYSPLPQVPDCPDIGRIGGFNHIFLPDDGGNGMSYFTVNLECTDTRIYAERVMQAGAWSEVRTSATIEPPCLWQCRRLLDCALLVNNKYYILGDVGYILRLDLASMSLCAINLPEGVQKQQKMENIEFGTGRWFWISSYPFEGFSYSCLPWHI